MNRYDNYFETGFEWIGEIPSSWELSRVGKFFTERSEKVDDVTYPPLSVTMNGIVEQLSDVAKSNDNDNRKLVKKDDFVINSRSDRKGSSGIAPRDGSVSLINIVLAPKDIDPKYIENLFKSYYFKEEYFRNGKGIHWDLWTTRWEQFKNINIPVPTIEEQKLISQYLDKKTNQIDSLIEKIQKKIDLLKEKRTSMINHCVTKGLDSNVEMKDSGVEWIGEIPENWSVAKIMYISKKVTDGSHFSPETQDSGKFYVTVSNVSKSNSISFDSCSKISEESFLELERNGCRPKKDDVLITKDGTIGRGLVVGEFNEYVILSSIGLIRFSKKINPEYGLYYLISGLNIEQMYSHVRGSGITRLTINLIKNLLMIIPTFSEQQKIVEYLDENTGLIDKTISIEEKRTKLLKEYRQSLISSVVTGKVRVTEDMI